MSKLKKFKQLSISLALLGCFAVTSKIGAMEKTSQEARIAKKQEILENMTRISRDGIKTSDLYWIINAIEKDLLGDTAIKKLFELGLIRKFFEFDQRNGNSLGHTLYECSLLKARFKMKKLDIAKDIARTSKEGLQNSDLEWIIQALYWKALSINDLKQLIKLGLEKYVNISSETIYRGMTLLEAAIGSYVLQIDAIGIDNDFIDRVKLLVSIGAKISDKTLKQADKTVEIIELSGEFSPKNPKNIIKYIEIVQETKNFLQSAEKKKQSMIKNLLDKKAKKFCDTRFHLLAEQPE